MKPRIFVTRPIPDAGLKLLRKDKRVSVDMYEIDQIIPRKELLKRAKGVTAILSILTDKMDAQLFDAAGPSLKMIANYAVGFDNIDLKEAAKRGIVVTNTPGTEIAETVAEHTIAMMFALAHRLIEADRFARAGKYIGWGPQMLLGTDVVGKTLGIVGSGLIGMDLVERMYDGFGVKIIYTDVKRNEKIEKDELAEFLTLDELLKRSDFVSIHVPLLPTTRHLIGAKQLRAMKKTAFLINTSRGPVVDEAALIAALQKKQIAGAGIDVYEFEPKIPLALRKLDNVVITPHTASATVETRQAMSRRAAENIVAFLDGKVPPNAIK
ncbi:MAG: D-glycerate dehydrogenase [Candidatus Uhrbacteria bacterium]